MFICLFPFLLLLSSSPDTNQSNLILQASLDAIVRSHTIRYDHERLVKTDGNLSMISSTSYLENNDQDVVLGMKFLIKDHRSSFIYNGSEAFLLDEQEKSIRIKRKPSKNDIENYYLYNSILTLKKNLPLIISDESIDKKLKDTVVQNKTYDLVTLRMFKKTMQSLGGFFPISEDRWFEYRLILDKSTHLPVELHQQNFSPSGEADQYIKVSFRNLRIDQKIDEQLLFYSSYLKKYQDLSNASPERKPLPPGTPQLNVSLPRFPDDVKQELWTDDSPVVLYFWIANCGYCIEAVPRLNQWMKTYQQKNIRIIGINAYDDKMVIDQFTKKYHPEYPTVYQGADLAKQYGIIGFPSVVILNKGKIVFSGGLEEEKIKEVLK